jgi:hypothetical protein
MKDNVELKAPCGVNASTTFTSSAKATIKN